MLLYPELQIHFNFGQSVYLQNRLATCTLNENGEYFYRCTVHLEDSLIITPTNALVYHLLI